MHGAVDVRVRGYSLENRGPLLRDDENLRRPGEVFFYTFRDVINWSARTHSGRTGG